MKRRASRLIVATAVAGLAIAPGGEAAAHPLGNFSVNHLTALGIEADRITVDTIIDIAEVPTTQDRPTVDRDRDGRASEAELDAHAAAECGAFADAATLTLGGIRIELSAEAAGFGYEAGQAGLETSRLRCSFTAEAAGLGATEQKISFVDGYRPGRVGWKEITAVGREVGLIDSPVPTTSVTDGLREYPDELLSAPLDVRSVEVLVGPPTEHTTRSDSTSNDVITTRPGILGTAIDGVQQRFERLIGGDLTVRVGFLAIALSLLLGASHALLPGHGKTVMAAYIAGRQGTARDAVVVGATVTATHTGGVLLLGLALTVSTALAGEVVLSWLGAFSGALIAMLGGAMLVSAVRRRHDGWLAHGHRHDHHHDHRGHDVHEHGDHQHRHGGGEPHGHSHGRHGDRASRRGLVGMGIAGGLVPSPSALIVLLSAIALGRTWFGVVLVIGYGLGMAGVLTLAGLLLVRVRDRLRRRVAGATTGLTARAAERWARALPFGTASLVLVVGTGLAVRSLATL